MRRPDIFDSHDSHSLDAEWTAMQRRWTRHDRWLRRIGNVAWAVFGLVVFAGAAHETGKMADKLPRSGVAGSAGVGSVASQGGHLGSPSVGAPVHSKSEGNCR